MCVGFTLCVQPYDITIEKTLRRGAPEELAVYQNAIRLQRATVMLQPRLTAVCRLAQHKHFALAIFARVRRINFSRRGAADISTRVNRESTCQRNAGRFPRRGSRRGLRLTSINHTRTRTLGLPIAYASLADVCVSVGVCVYVRACVACCEQRRGGDLQLRLPPIILTCN